MAKFRIFVINSYVLIGLCTSVVCGSLSFALVWYFGNQPAVIVQDVHEVDGVAVSGGFLDLVAHINRVRSCPTHVERWLWRDTNIAGEIMRQWVPLAGPDAPPSPIGHGEKYTISLPLPNNISPGRWWYYSRSRDDCSFWPGLWSASFRETTNVPVVVQERIK